MVNPRTLVSFTHSKFVLSKIVEALSSSRLNLLFVPSSIYEGHSVNSEIKCVRAIAYLLAESWCCLYKALTFISHYTKETIS